MMDSKTQLQAADDDEFAQKIWNDWTKAGDTSAAQPVDSWHRTLTGILIFCSAFVCF